MASAPNIGNRNDMTLWASDVMLDDLLRRADDWDARPQAEQLDFFLEWEELMDRLSGVAEDAEGGHLAAGQRERLSLLAIRLSQARPIIERLGLDYPDLGRLSLAS
jgi:hypothetical protein